MAGYVTLVILNDGSTYTDVEGCTIAVVTEEELERVEAEGNDAKDFNPIMEIRLSDISIPLDNM